MPRKRKKHESSHDRWKRNRKHAEAFQASGYAKDGSRHYKIECDAMEFACLFTLEGGAENIGPGHVRAFNHHGHKPGEAVAPNILDIGRDKASQLMAKATDAEVFREAKEKLQNEKKAKRVNRLLNAQERDSFSWHRQEVPDQNMRSVLVGSNNGKDATSESDALVVCFKGDDGRYHVGEERWSGEWSPADIDGHRERVGVNFRPLPIDFHDEKEAHKAVMFAAYSGSLERFEDRRDSAFFQRMAKRLALWHHLGQDMKKIYKKQANR